MVRRTGVFRCFLPLGELMSFRFQVSGAMLAVAALTVNATWSFSFRNQLNPDVGTGLKPAPPAGVRVDLSENTK